MSWPEASIPPLGLCAVCLTRHDEDRPAVVLINGSALCREHAKEGVSILAKKPGTSGR